MWYFLSILSLLCWIEIRQFLTKQTIMSVISEFAARQNEKFNLIATAVDGVTADIVLLKKKIEQLQNTPGEITAEDQALLNSIENLTNGVATKLSALDAATETVPTPDEPAIPAE